MAKRKTHHKRRTQHRTDSPLNLIGQATKAIVGVTALGITVNALSELGKH